MKTIINKEEMKREWVLNKWYEKAIYVFGSIYVVFLAMAFFFGIMLGLAGL